MASYKRRREDESTFGFGRYPKRSRKDHHEGDRAYHSVSVNRLHNDRHRSKLNGLNATDQKFYHYSLSSELFARNSNSQGQRFSTCSNSHGSGHYSKRPKPYKTTVDESCGIEERKNKPSKEFSVSKLGNSTYSRVCVGIVYVYIL